MSADKKQKAEGFEDSSVDLLSDDILDTLEQASKEDQSAFFKALAKDVEEELAEGGEKDMSNEKTLVAALHMVDEDEDKSDSEHNHHDHDDDDFEKTPQPSMKEHGFDDELQDFSVEESVKNFDSEPATEIDALPEQESDHDPEATLIEFGKDNEDDQVLDLQYDSDEIDSDSAPSETEEEDPAPEIFDDFEPKDQSQNPHKEPQEEIKKSAEDFKTSVLKESNEDRTMAVGHDSSQNQEPQAAVAQNGRNPLIDLKNADYIQFAQEKIKSLEKQLSDLRAECEELALAGDHFKNLSEERGQKVKTLESKVDEVETLSKEEKKILNESLASKDLRISTLQEHVESLEEELESRYNRIRVRERDLESRLEILKQEQTAVTKSKDEMILKLRSQNNGLQSEIEKLRIQHQKTSSHLQNKEDALRRTMKALKLSLTMLESQNKE